MTPLFLCLYLLFFVVDVLLVWVWVGADVLVALAGFHLVLFFVGIVLFRDEFYTLAQKYQTRIVFSPRVYGCFSLASGLLAGALFFAQTYATFLARWVLLALLIFRCGVQLFDFFPVKTRHSQQIVFWSVLALLWALSVFLWGAFEQWRGEPWMLSLHLFPKTVEQQRIPTTWTQTLTSGVTLEQIAQTAPWMWTTDNTWAVATGSQLEKEEKTVTWTVMVQDTAPVTYRVLLPYLDDQWLLPDIQEKPVFPAIWMNNALYGAFQRAWWMKMIGTNINPDRQVRCENLMVVLWLAKKRPIDTTKGVLEAYWETAKNKDMLGSCATRAQIATQDMLRDVP